MALSIDLLTNRATTKLLKKDLLLHNEDNSDRNIMEGKYVNTDILSILEREMKPKITALCPRIAVMN